MLSYCDRWKDYDMDITSAHESIADLCKTLQLLVALLGDEELVGQKQERVGEGMFTVL